MAEDESTGAGARASRTGVCRHCGALVGAGEARCMVCGTPVSSAAQASRARPPHADPETLRFLRAVISRPAVFTIIFIVANVFLYLLMWLSGGAQGNVLLAYGAKLNYLINEPFHQWWRFVTPVFLHVHIPGLGPLHLLSNMYGLFMLGPYVEKLYGSARFVVFWILTGVAGVVASYLTMKPEWARGAGLFLFKEFDSPSAGASGALFGLMGVLFVFGIKYRHELPEGLKRVFGTGLLPTLAINLFIGYFGRRFIDNAAHLGGLLSGMALALVVGYKRPGARGAVAHAWHAAQVACLLLVAVSFLMVVRHFNAESQQVPNVPPPRLSNFAERAKTLGGRSSVVPFIGAVNAGQSALVGFLSGAEGAGGDAGTLAAAAEKLEKAPAPTDAAGALRDDLKALVARARAVEGDESLAPAERRQRLKQLDADFGAWQESFAQWVEREGEDFGIGMQKNEKKQDEGKK